jgi:hypothetical protein
MGQACLQVQAILGDSCDGGNAIGELSFPNFSLSQSRGCSLAGSIGQLALTLPFSVERIKEIFILIKIVANGVRVRVHYLGIQKTVP